MEKEYKVVIYYEDLGYEEYEYFDNEKESIDYAKSMRENNVITSVYEIITDFDNNEEKIGCIFGIED